MRNCITVLEGCHLGIPLQNNLLDEKMEVIGDNTCMDSISPCPYVAFSCDSSLCTVSPLSETSHWFSFQAE